MSVHECLMHAIDLCMLGEWEHAKRTLEHTDDPLVPRLAALMTQQQKRERERADAQAIARHELGNALSIAQANVEAMMDGLLDMTPERLADVYAALQNCGVLLEAMKSQGKPERRSRPRIGEFDLGEVISSQVAVLRGIAEAKNVRVKFRGGSEAGKHRGDPDRIARGVRNVLLSAVRYTPPGGTIDVNCEQPAGDMKLSFEGTAPAISNGHSISLISKLMEALGDDAYVAAEDSTGTSFRVKLAALAPAGAL